MQYQLTNQVYFNSNGESDMLLHLYSNVVLKGTLVLKYTRNMKDLYCLWNNVCIKLNQYTFILLLI
jgi:hypothetical protein